MEVLAQKKEILDWISGLDNPVILNAVYSIKQKQEISFKERFEKGITAEEFKEKTTQFLKSLPWKESK